MIVHTPHSTYHVYLSVYLIRHIFTVTHMHIYKYILSIRHTYFLFEGCSLLLANEYCEMHYEGLEGHKS